MTRCRVYNGQVIPVFCLLPREILRPGFGMSILSQTLSRQSYLAIETVLLQHGSRQTRSRWVTFPPFCGSDPHQRLQIYSVSRDGALFQWEFVRAQQENANGSHSNSVDVSLRWRITQRHFFFQNNAKVDCSTYHPASNLMVIGFSSGIFCLYELPEFSTIHTLR